MQSHIATVLGLVVITATIMAFFAYFDTANDLPLPDWAWYTLFGATVAAFLAFTLVARRTPPKKP